MGVQAATWACIRKPAPAFAAQAWWNGKFQEVSLEQFRGKYVVLFFWPLDFTFVCPTEICQFSDKAAEFEAAETQLIGVSIDLPVGRNVDEVLRMVKAFQYTDIHGEVCPSGWEPGKATMVPDHASDRLANFWATEHGK